MVGLREKRIIIAAAAVVAVALAVSGLVLAGVIPLSSTLSCFGVFGASRTFIIVADLNGYNNSRTQVGLGIWPIMNVSRCDSVTIKLVNTDNQAHGLAVGGYTGEFTIPPGRTFSVGIVAYKTGHWRVFCTIVCTVHESMQNAQLNVT